MYDNDEYSAFDEYDWERVERNRTNRRLRLQAAREKGRHTKEQWAAVLEETGGICVRCGTGERRIMKDHVEPIYRGGSDGIENLQPLCSRCNSAKGCENINWLWWWRLARKVTD